MKFNLQKLISAALLFGISAQAFAETNTLSARYTLTRDCGENAVYVGPHLASGHGGYCLSASLGMSTVHVEYTENKRRCSEKKVGYKGTYVGPNKDYEHGGSCLWVRGQDAVSTYTTSKNCGSGYIYVGPNRPDRHGGSCLKQPSRSDNFRIPVPQSEMTVTGAATKDCPGGTYVGANYRQRHGGQCVTLPPFDYHHSYTENKDCDGYVGPRDAALHGGTCLWDLSGRTNFWTITTHVPDECELVGGQYAGSAARWVHNVLRIVEDEGRLISAEMFTGNYSELGGVCLFRL